MKIQDQAVVTMTYVLRENDENGPILQETTKENPFVCIFGMHQLLPKFEENLMGKEPGDKYAFHLTPEEGYGERDEA
ncbi:MAG: FKBP-type peptidyl-prolyl cis-trans isomerase, partial [Bacteroidales bacterium]|nr:FKBP-type peptidyl-prolyl cis-trans isomerase [Bacteroidales bacterium]